MNKNEAAKILVERLKAKELILKQQNKQLPKLHQRFMNMYKDNIRDANYNWTLKALVKEEKSATIKSGKN
jgi:hypothetical protein